MKVLFNFLVSTVEYLSTVEIIQYVGVAFALYGLVLCISCFLFRRV